MSNEALAAPPPSPLWLRILRSPYSRLLMFVAMVFAIQSLVNLISPNTGLSAKQALAMDIFDPRLWLGALRRALPVVLAYVLLVRLIEWRRISELAGKRLLPDASLGWLLGMALMLVVAALMAATGAYRLAGINDHVDLLTPLLVVAVLPGITEELIFRGAFFRLIEESLGTWIALLLSGLLFGAAHLTNPNASLWTSLAIAVEAGLLLGMAYVWKRSLWFCMALHAAWNFTQGSLLGVSVSGFALPSLAKASTQGPVLLSGGEFGAEASILAVLLSLAVSAYFTRKAIAAGQIRAPFWVRRRRDQAQSALVREVVEPRAC